MIFFRAFGFLRYIVLSGHRKGHGIHSPFVYDLVSRVFRNKTGSGIVFSIEEIRKKLISDKRIIKVNDLGSGTGQGKKMKESRKVSEIARNSPVSRKYGKLLANMAAESGRTFILELGTSFGISTMYMALANHGAKIHTIEGCPETAKIAVGNFEKAQIGNIELHSGSFDERLPEILINCTSPGMIFIDGNHRKEPLLRYFKMIAEVSDNKTVIVIDDIHMSAEMEEAWKEIRLDERVSVTIDIFRMGMVFFRQGISRSHHIIRY